MRRRVAHRPTLFLALACLLLAGCVRATIKRDAPAEVIRIDGSQGVMPLVSAIAAAYREANPRAVIEMGTGLGSRARVDSLVSGRIDIALASTGVVPSEMARQRLVVHEIARVPVVFAVNPGVTVANLTQRQVCDVYSGAITNWRVLGGPDLPIAARTRPVGEVDGDVVVAGIGCFRAAAASGVARAMPLPEDMSRELEATPGAIGMTSTPYVQRSAGRVRALALDGVHASAESVRSGAYPLVRAAFLLVHADASPATRRFIEFAMSDKASAIIQSNGGVAIR